jgi:hypothetical protein
MNPQTKVMISILAALGLLLAGCAVGGRTGDTSGEDETSRGLKEALRIGTANAVDEVARPDGYYRNPLIKILLPESVRKVEKVLRLAGFGHQVDTFEMSMNRAAERAAPEAKTLIWDAIRQMRFADAWQILKGRENEATLYLKDKTYARLQKMFRPVVHEAMGEVGVTRSYQQLEASVRAIPFAGELVSFDLDGYVTDNALDGLFQLLAEEEARIRRDPVARVTELLRRVFARQ